MVQAIKTWGSIPVAILLTTLTATCSGLTPTPQPPVAEVIPKTLESHGEARIDNYYWLRERDNPKVIDYLNAENAYTKAVMKHTEAFQEQLFEEIKGRIKQDDRSVPYRHDEYFYYDRYEDGKEYPIYCRKKGTLEADEQIILDVNVLAEGHEFYQVSGLTVSPDHNILGYGVDTVGRRFYTIYFKNLSSGETLKDVIPNTTRVMAWAADNATLFYTTQDPETLRWNKIHRHSLGTDPAGDKLIYEEPDETFWAWVEKTRSEEYLLIRSQQTLSDEVRFLSADDPNGTFQMFLPRQRNHEYSVDHANGRFYIRTNLDAKNFRLMSCTPRTTGNVKRWREEIGHREDVFFESLLLFKNYMVIEERKDGLIRFRVRPNKGEEYYTEFEEPAYVASFGDNYTFDTPMLRYEYASMITPQSVYDFDMSTRQKTLLKQDEVLGGYDKSNYVTERHYAPARDGARIPISLFYRKGTAKDGTAPLLLYGYGSYGYSMDASFRSTRLTLVDRGFVYAVAHIRGGQELGRDWYDNGKLLNKKNTFYDFIDCAEYLIAEGLADSTKVFAHGGSAGGLLIGAVMNIRPDLWRGLLADVPFVDVITTMEDASIPLTTAEYDEWGNPADQEYYDYMMSYSPYDNVEAKDYPAMLVMAGLHDSQVQYWEPAKWVAKLRAMKTDNNRLLLNTDMEAGHGGASGRYKRYREYALMYGFVLDEIGINQ